mgnify:CR=1 FL=1
MISFIKFHSPGPDSESGIFAPQMFHFLLCPDEVNKIYEQSDLVAEDVANKLFDLGYNNFDIEVSV